MRLLRHILGFTVGFGLFGVLIPLWLIRLFQVVDDLLGLEEFGLAAFRLIVAIPLLLSGLFFALWSNIFLVTRGRGGPADGFEVAISPRTEKLVVTGPYRYSRNPMVYGVFSAYFAIAFLRGSLGGLVVLAVIVPLFVSYLKRVEERRLLRDFGEEYEQYRREVSMIVPLPPKR
jgi:protein-S-isoprenylcysteine O-methyltransferase Ste14